MGIYVYICYFKKKTGVQMFAHASCSRQAPYIPPTFTRPPSETGSTVTRQAALNRIELGIQGGVGIAKGLGAQCRGYADPVATTSITSSATKPANAT